MPKSKNLNLGKPIVNNLPRNAFDLSQKHVFSAPTGLIVPFFALEVNPNEKVRLGFDMVQKCRPLNTASFARIKQVTEFHYVPFQALYSYFDNVVTNLRGRDTFNSTVLMNAGRDGLNSLQYDRYNTIPSAKFGNVLHGLDTENDMFGVNKLTTACRYLDMLGYGNFSDWMNTATKPAGDGPAFNLFRLAAFQKIYNDNFRVDNYEPNNPYSYNLDALVKPVASNQGITEIYGEDGGAAALSAAKSYEFVKQLLTPRYALYSRDYTTEVIPSTLYNLPQRLKYTFGSAPALIGSSSSNQYAQKGFNLIGTFTDDFNSQVDPSISGAPSHYRIQDGSLIDIDEESSTQFMSLASLRNAYALERMLEVSRRAGKTYADQIEAHFGRRPNRHPNDSVYLGGKTTVVNINEVLNQAASETAPLGDLGGRGISSDNADNINFESTEHGVIIGIMYFVPLADYSSARVDPFNRKLNAYDYFQPEAQDLGYQILQSSDVFWKYSLGNQNPKDPNVILGWQTRYKEYKSAMDIAHLQYGLDNTTLGTFTVRKPLRQIDFTDDQRNAKLGPAYFHVDPTSTDSLFVSQVTNDIATDHYDVNIYVRCSVIRPMSVDGLPTMSHFH